MGGFTYKETCQPGWKFWASDKHECVAPDVNDAQELGPTYGLTGNCPCAWPNSCEDKVGASAPQCSAGDVDLGERDSCCGSNYFGACDGKYGKKKIRKCQAKATGTHKVFEMYSPSSCDGRGSQSGNGVLTPNLSVCNWCKEGSQKYNCWLPYYLSTSDNMCTPV